MTETTRTTECSAPGPTLYVAFELGNTKWVLAFTAGVGQRPRLRTMAAGDLRALQHEIAAACDRFTLPRTTRVRSCYEAGRDGFWLHRWLVAQGVDNVVVDSSSIEVSRRARRAKTDRLDAAKLLNQLLRWAQGERRVWSIVHVPTPEAEAARQVTREIEAVRQDRMRVRNRIQGLLATQGIRCPLTQKFPTLLERVQTGDGRPLPAPWRERFAREWAHLQTIEARLRELRAARDAAIAQGADHVMRVARHLCQLRGVAQTGAMICSTELFGTRTFRNRRQVGGLLGLVPAPYRSGEMVQDQGIMKTGRTQLRRVSIQLAWGWLRWQPDSALTGWFHRRFGGAGGRSRRIGIVALARKLMIALWQFVAYGVIPEGARLKSA